MGGQMELQKIVLGQYMVLNNNPTLKTIAADTGIQFSRVFRIFNGSSMKLSEYQIFQQRVKEKMGLTDTLEAIAFDCSLKLSPAAIKEIEIYLNRKIQIWKMKQSSIQKNYTINKVMA